MQEEGEEKMKNKYEGRVAEVKDDSIIVLLANGERKLVSDSIFSFEALVNDELWVSLDDHGMVTQVEQKDFSRGYAVPDDTGEGPHREVYVSPARKI
jgi:hypothetical protein